MRSATQLIRSFLADPAGVSSAEYAVCLALLVLVAVGAATVLASFPSAVDSVSGSLTQTPGPEAGLPQITYSRP